MEFVYRQPQMLKSGAISSNHVPDSGAGYRQDRRRSDSSVSTPSQPSRRRIAFDPAPQDDFFLPDFCAPRMVLAIVLVIELLALTFALARPGGAEFLTELAEEFSPEFSRIHRSVLVSVGYLEVVERDRDGKHFVRIRNRDERLPVSRRQVRDLKRLLTLR